MSPPNHEAIEAVRWGFVLALVAEGLLLCGFSLVGARIAKLIIGDDRRVSTSKTIAVVWTFVVAAMLLGIVYASFLDHSQALDATNASGVVGQYALLFGGPLGAAILAKGIVKNQVEKNPGSKPPADSASAKDLVSNDAGDTDLGDFQYVMFNSVALVYVIGTLLHDPISGVPHIPDVLLGLTSVSAVGYVGKKALPPPTVNGAPSSTQGNGPTGSGHKSKSRQKEERMAEEPHRRHGGFGWRPSLPDPRDVPADPSEIPILAEVDPRGQYMPPIYDQGQLGSCTANAVAAAIDADRSLDGQGRMTPSRLAIYWFERFLEHQPPAEDQGAMGRDGFKAARRYGVLPEEDWPYTDDSNDPRFAQDPRSSDAWGPDHWVLDDKYKSVRRSLTDFKRVLSNKQTIAFGFAVFTGFVSEEARDTGIVPTPDASQIIPHEGHEVLAIGYLEGHPDHCLCRNSWGTEWGMDGYFLMPWSVLLDPTFSSDFRTIYRALQQ